MDGWMDGRDIWEGERGVNKGEKKETYLIICGKGLNSKERKNYIKSGIPPYAIFHSFFLLLIL